MSLDDFDPEYAPTNALLTHPGRNTIRDSGTEIIAQIRDRPDHGTVRIHDFRYFETRTLPVDDVADGFSVASEIMRPDDLDFPVHHVAEPNEGYLVSRYTVNDTGEVSVERFFFEQDPECLDLLTVTDTHPPRDVTEFLDERSLYITS